MFLAHPDDPTCHAVFCSLSSILPKPDVTHHGLLPLLFLTQSFFSSPSNICFISLSKIQASSLGPFFLFSFFGSVGYILGILYFMANIYLLVSIYHECPFGSEISHLGWLFSSSIHLPEKIIMSFVFNGWGYIFFNLGKLWMGKKKERRDECALSLCIPILFLNQDHYKYLPNSPTFCLLCLSSYPDWLSKKHLGILAIHNRINAHVCCCASGPFQKENKYVKDPNLQEQKERERIGRRGMLREAHG